MNTVLPDPENLESLLQQAHGYALEFINSLEHREVYPNPEALVGLEQFDQALPDTPMAASEMLKQLHDAGSAAAVATTGGRYFGFVNGAIHPPALAAKWLVDTWDQNTALYCMSPIASTLEQICQRWLVQLFHLPEQTVAGFVSGSSTSIFCGLCAARNALLEKQSWDVHAKGLFGAPEIRVVVGAQAHATVYKALSTLGLGRDRVEIVPADDQGRMIAAELPELDNTTLLLVQAGNVNSGAFDPMQELCERANAAGAWVHVDGAFGLWAGASGSTYPLYQGSELADSWSVDAHKTINAPYDCGVILCKHPEALVSALQASGSYIQWSEQRDGMLFTPEMSRRARAAELWATLRTLGTSGVEQMIDQLCARASLFGSLLLAEGFSIQNQVVFNQVLVSCETPKITQQTVAHIQQSGECWCGGASWNGQPVIRISVCSWKTSVADIERSVIAFVNAREHAREHVRGMR